MFENDYDHTDSVGVRRPPLSILALAVVVVAVAFGLLSATNLTGHLVGYGLGSFVCVSLSAVFIKVDLIRRNSRDAVYLELRSVRYMWPLVLIAGVTACGIHAAYVATELVAQL